MWQIDFTADTDLAPGSVWAAIRDLETGAVDMRSGDRRRLNGTFAVHSTITATPVGLGPLESTITELVDGELLAVRTSFQDLVLLLRHTLRPSGGGTRITRHLEITGPGADERGPIAGPRISADYPEALGEIIDTARNRI